MEKYYTAYDKRYKQVHDMNLQWASNEPSPIVQDVILRYGIKNTQSILEIGCGEGRDAFWLLENHYNVLGSDISKEAIEYCKKKNPEFADSFIELDVCRDHISKSFDFIYSIAVIHMLVQQEDRNKLLSFIRDHITNEGYGLILTMGDGEIEISSDVTKAFDNVQRTHQETRKEISIAATSCRMVNFRTFDKEISENGLYIVEKGITSSVPGFPQMMYAVVKKDHV